MDAPVELANNGAQETLTPEQIEPRINWQRFPKNGGRVIAGILQELTVPAIDSDPQTTHQRYEDVVDSLQHLSNHSRPGYDRLSNAQIGEELREYAHTAKLNGKRELGSELRMLSATMLALAKRRVIKD